MKLEKAKELLELDIAGLACRNTDLEDAERIGIEAIEKELKKRITYPNATFQPLPSETKE